MINHVKVHITLDAEWSGVGGESLWADDLGDGRAKVDNVPFFADLFSLGSIVLTDEQGEVLGVESHEYAANGIVGLVEDADADAVRSLATALEANGIMVERATQSAFMCAIPADKVGLYETMVSGSAVVGGFSYEPLPAAPFML